MFPYQQYNMDKELLDCLEIIYNLIDFLDDIRLALETEKDLTPLSTDLSTPSKPLESTKLSTCLYPPLTIDNSTVSAFLTTLSLEECSHLTPDLGTVPIHNTFPIDSTHAALLQNIRKKGFGHRET